MSAALDFPEPLEKDVKPPAGGTPGAKPKPDAKPKPTPGGRQAPLQGRLQEALGGIGIMIALVNEIDGLAIVEGAERLSHALDKAAKQNPSVRRTLEAALTGGVWAEVVFASGAIFVPIALNHRLLPASLTGGLVRSANANGNGPDEPPQPV
jgi:hypothetical protein